MYNYNVKAKGGFVMKIKYFGTAAAEAVPAFFCSCDVCEKSRQAGGRNIRTRSQALIDGELLIDFPADTYLHIMNYGLDLRNIKACLITHGHDDHIYPYDLMYRQSPVYSVFPNGGVGKVPLDIYITAKSSKELMRVIRKEHLFAKDKAALSVNKIKKFVPFSACGYTVHPLRANHAKSLDPVIYIIEKGGKSLLYAHDTGLFPKDTWDYIEKSGIKLDFVSLDCTSTNREKVKGTHLNLTGCVMIKERLIKNGNADENTVFCLNHFSHNGGYTYDELVPVAQEKGFLVSYDSMEIEF